MKKKAIAIKQLVIADDDTDDQMLLKELVEEFCSNIKITCISDGKQLMDKLHMGEIPDLVLLDLNMPFKTGSQCLYEMRTDKKLQHLPVVILSTSKSKSDIDLCYKNGAHLFYSKPWNIEECRKLIQSILQINWQDFKRAGDLDNFMTAALETKVVKSF
jgi:CheY-like chemotaxis protein